MEDDVYAAPESGFESHLPGESGSFSIVRCLNAGGEAFRNNPGPGILATVVMVVLLGAAYFAVLTAIGSAAGTDVETMVVGVLVLSFGGMLAVYLLYRMLQAGMQILGMQVRRGGGRVEDVFAGFHRPGPICAATAIIYIIQLIIPLIIFVLLVALVAGSEALGEQIDAMESDDLGIALLILLVLGVWLLKLYFDARLLLVYPLILERKSGAIAAIVQSWRLTAPVQIQLALLTILTEIIFFAGLLCCGIGALLTTPIHYSIHGVAVLDLLDEDAGGDAPESSSAEPGPDRPDASGAFDRPDDSGGPKRFGDAHVSDRTGERRTPEASPGRDPNPYDASPYS